ncbi:unnamed protein product [Caenorhabditis sp. 36 PRJEB53466]|nr:unnamed protein product [Caenorhabditis sp. 36 PRJEB53466]
MSPVIGRLPSVLYEKECPGNENEVDTVFTDESLSIFPCFPLFSKEQCREGNFTLLKSEPDEKEREVIIPPIRRKHAVRHLSNPFEKHNVPDLVLTNIFGNLNKKDLCSVMLVCHKWRKFSTISTTWSVTDLAERPVSEVSLCALMKRKLRVFRLAGAKPNPEAMISPPAFQMALSVVSRLEYLDLSRSNLTHRQLMIVLKPCKKLQCLSLEGSIIDNEIAECIAQNKDIRELDLSMTSGITAESALEIFKNLKKLEQLNISWCGVDSQILDILLENIPSQVCKLNICGTTRNNGLTDKHMRMLTTACPKLLDLDLSDNVDISGLIISLIMDNFERLHTLSLNRCYGVDPNIIVNLNCMPSLQFLNVHGCITDSNMDLFLDFCNRLKINCQYFNFTAKPVANTNNNTRIWGQRVKERY